MLGRMLAALAIAVSLAPVAAARAGQRRAGAAGRHHPAGDDAAGGRTGQVQRRARADPRPAALAGQRPGAYRAHQRGRHHPAARERSPRRRSARTEFPSERILIAAMLGSRSFVRSGVRGAETARGVSTRTDWRRPPPFRRELRRERSDGWHRIRSFAARTGRIVRASVGRIVFITHLDDIWADRNEHVWKRRCRLQARYVTKWS